MFKWRPVYRITVYTKDETVSVTLPLTCKMTITRSILTQNVTADVQIYGLSKDTRKAVYQPPFNTWGDKSKFITIEAGYGAENAMYQIFKGVIIEAYSTKQGGTPDVITQIKAQALDLLSARSSHQFPAGTDIKDIIKTCAADMPNCTLGSIGGIEGEIKTPLTVDGASLEQINKVTGGSAFIDNGVLNVILGNECIEVPVPLITDENALLETPIRNANNLTIKTLFHPDLMIAQLVQIKSSIAPDFDGYYKLQGFTHDLFFSGSQDGQRITTMELWNGNLIQNTPLYVSGDKVQTGFKKVKGEEITPVQDDIINVNWIKPVDGVITSNFGRRAQPKEGASINHSGIDLRASIGTPVKAIADGTVTAARSGMRGYGTGVFIDHGNVNGKKVVSEYGHLSRFIVLTDRKVKQGDIIAYSGNTGTSTGPHLHLTIRENGVAVNPANYIKTL